MKYFVVLIVSLAILAGCASSQKLAPTQADVDRVSSKFPGYTLEALTQGKTLYEQNCGTCHKLYKPRTKSEASWQQIVPSMVKKAVKKGAKIDAAGEELILKYLITQGPAAKAAK